MTNEEFQKQCPILCDTRHLYKTKKEAMLAQAEFFKTHTFIFGVLDVTKAQILRLRYGIDDGKMLTLEKIGEIFNMSHQAVCQLEKKAYRQLKRPRCMLLLRDYTDETFDESLLDTIVGNCDSLIRKDIIRIIKQDSIKLVQDISIKQLDFKYGKNEEGHLRVIQKLNNAGIETCDELIEYMREHNNFNDIDLGYTSYTALLFAIWDLIDKGNAKITDEEDLKTYARHKYLKEKQAHEEQVKKQEHLARIEEQKLMAEIIRQGRLRNASTRPEDVLLEDINFTLRTYNRLKSQGLNTIKDILDFYTNHNGSFKSIRNLGIVSEQEIVDKLNMLGISICTIKIRSKEELFEDIMNYPHLATIDLLNLSTRSYNCLRNQGINTVKDLMDMPINLSNIKNLGERSKREIINIMNELGINFGDNVVDFDR